MYTNIAKNPLRTFLGLNREKNKNIKALPKKRSSYKKKCTSAIDLHRKFCRKIHQERSRYFAHARRRRPSREVIMRAMASLKKALD